MTSRTKKALTIFLKFAIVVLAFVFIYRKLTDNKKLEDFFALIRDIPQSELYLMTTVILLLMFVNWFVEAVKWRFVISAVERISLQRAVESVFCGLTWAIFTPNRVGEYGGRIFFLTPRKRVFGAIAMGVGSMGQLVLTNVLGSIGVFWFVCRFVRLDTWLYFLLGFGTLLFCGFFLMLFFNIGLINKVLLRIKFLKGIHRFFIVLEKYRKPDLVRIFIYCIARFAVFTTQYYLIIHFLIPQLQAVDIVMMVFILLFVQSALPSLDLLDFGVRGFTASFFFSYITNQQITIIAATTCIWLVNLIIPAMIGSIFVYKLNFFGTRSN